MSPSLDLDQAAVDAIIARADQGDPAELVRLGLELFNREAYLNAAAKMRASAAVSALRNREMDPAAQAVIEGVLSMRTVLHSIAMLVPMFGWAVFESRMASGRELLPESLFLVPIHLAATRFDAATDAPLVNCRFPLAGPFELSPPDFEFIVAPGDGIATARGYLRRIVHKVLEHRRLAAEALAESLSPPLLPQTINARRETRMAELRDEVVSVVLEHKATARDEEMLRGFVERIAARLGYDAARAARLREHLAEAQANGEDVG